MKLALILSVGSILFLSSCDGTDHAGNGGNTGQRGGPNSATGRPTGGATPEETTTNTQGNEGSGTSAPDSAAGGSTSNGVHQN